MFVLKTQLNLSPVWLPQTTAPPSAHHVPLCVSHLPLELPVPLASPASGVGSVVLRLSCVGLGAWWPLSQLWAQTTPCSLPPSPLTFLTVCPALSSVPTELEAGACKGDVPYVVAGASRGPECGQPDGALRPRLPGLPRGALPGPSSAAAAGTGAPPHAPGRYRLPCPHAQLRGPDTHPLSPLPASLPGSPRGWQRGVPPPRWRPQAALTTLPRACTPASLG